MTPSTKPTSELLPGDRILAFGQACTVVKLLDAGLDMLCVDVVQADGVGNWFVAAADSSQLLAS